VVQLSQLIAQNITSKPEELDSSKIFNHVRSCYLALVKTPFDNLSCHGVTYEQNMKMLLAICQACSWFSYKQRSNFKRWYEEYNDKSKAHPTMYHKW